MHADVTAAGQLVSILAIYREECVERLTKLQKRAARYGQTISWTETPRTVDKSYTRPDGKRIKRTVDMVDMVIHGSAPRVGDFVFDAQLERTPAGVLIAGRKDAKVGKLGQNWDGRCDHCGSKRARTYGYVVSKGRTRKVVGKSCLRDYLGTDAPAGLAAMFTHLRELDSAGDDEGMFGGFGGGWGDLTESVIVASRAAIAIWGWRPASYDGQTTGFLARLASDTPRYHRGREIHGEERKLIRDELKAHGDRYEREAQAVLAWGRALKGRSDYEHNLRVALANDTTNTKRYGLVVSASAAYDRQQAVEAERKAEKAKRPTSEWFGKVGERVTVDSAELVGRIVLPDYGFGPQILFKFVDPAGRAFSWKTGSQPRVDGQPLELGRSYKVAAAIKQHAEYKGEKETRVTRAKFEGTK